MFWGIWTSAMRAFAPHSTAQRVNRVSGGKYFLSEGKHLGCNFCFSLGLVLQKSLTESVVSRAILRRKKSHFFIYFISFPFLLTLRNWVWKWRRKFSFSTLKFFFFLSITILFFICSLIILWKWWVKIGDKKCENIRLRNEKRLQWFVKIMS